MNAEGTIMESEILGAILMRCDLSGMPELRLGLNDKLISTANFLFNFSHSFPGLGNATGTAATEMEDVKFHQCVRLDDFVADRTITFIPPDGSFELMTYRIPSPSGTFSTEGSSASPLLLFIPEIVTNIYSGTRVEIFFKLKSNMNPSNPNYKKRSNNASTIICNEVWIEIPIEEDAMNLKFKNARKLGKIQYKPEKNCVCWKIKRIPLFFTRELTIKVEYNLPSIRSKPSLAPATRLGAACSPSISSMNVPSTIGVFTIGFEIPYFSVSGLQVKYLKIIEKSGYQALPWVRYITKHGKYQMRLPSPNVF
jgi:AP-1 complex subunit mu